MRQQSRIVSFDDARRSMRERRFAYDEANERDFDGRRPSSRAQRGSAASSRRTRPSSRASGAAVRSSRSSGLSAERAADATSSGEKARGASFAEKVSARAARAKRLRTKEKADRRFARQYGDDSASRAADAGGPRAAVYRGEMGSQHKKAARMQGDAPAGRSPNRVAKPSGRFPRRALTSLAVAACLVMGALFLYSPAQQYYQQIRERDRLQAEYDAVQQRNEAIQSEVDQLSTAEGVEDRAHKEFGWVKEGESIGSVTGISVEDESSFTANIVPGTVEAPDTWYSGFLDQFFGVE